MKDLLTSNQFISEAFLFLVFSNSFQRSIQLDTTHMKQVEDFQI